jgi:RNA polymerase sigma factor (sigma-70 family)
MTTHKAKSRIGCAGTVATTTPERRRVRGDDPSTLLSAAKAGDQRAWSLLVGRYGASIKAVARRHRLSAANQDEVAQRTWLRLVENIDSLREPAAVGGWLRAVARHECLRVLAASEREVPVEGPLPLDVSDSTAVEDEVIEAMRKQAVHDALEALPEHERRVLRLLLAEPNLNYHELSARLGIPRGSIGPTRGRGLARLRRDPHFTHAIDGHHDRRTPARPLRGHDLT